MLMQDPIEQVLALLRPESILSARLDAVGPWALRLPEYPHLKFGTVVSGDCWLEIEGNGEAIKLSQGDYYLISNPPPYRMASDLSLEASEIRAVFAKAENGVARIGPVDDGRPVTSIIGGHFIFDELNAPLLLGVLPMVIHIKRKDSDSGMRKLLDLLIAEVATSRTGRSLVIDRLAQVMLVEALRDYSSAGRQGASGWLGALSDKGITYALQQMHADMKHRWALKELSLIAGMSRSSFAARFKKLVGTAPLDYLIQWRINFAKDALRNGQKSISAIAFEIGYESESAFSTAFKRVVGKSPSEYRAGFALDQQFNQT